MKFFRHILLTCIPAVGLSTIPLTTHSSELGSIKGIKWKQELPPRGGELNDRVYGRLARPIDDQGHYISWDRLADQLALQGVQSVAFRIDKVSRYIDENGNGSGADEMENYHSDIKIMTNELEARGIKVLLFARMWLSNRTNDDVFALFDTYLSTLSEADRNKVDGIALTEIHLDKMSTLKTRAKWIPPKFENAYPDWLKQRMFLIPGLDNGFRFTDVNQQDSFHQDMSTLVGEFAFVVKSMKLKDKDDKDKLYSDFAKHVEWNGRDVSEREAYMNEEMGLAELVEYQETASAQYPKMANIVYWGDSGDAMTNVNPKAAQALHNVLNVHGGTNNRGTFMYFGVGGDNMLEEGENGVERTVAKSIIWYDKDTDAHRVQNLEYGKWDKVQGVYDQWNSWFQDTPNYH